jgi:hypothetical protein
VTKTDPSVGETSENPETWANAEVEPHTSKVVATNKSLRMLNDGAVLVLIYSSLYQAGPSRKNRDEAARNAPSSAQEADVPRLIPCK